MATGIPELDRDLNFMLKALPTYDGEVSSDIRKQGKAYYSLLKGILIIEINKLPLGDMRNEIIENLNTWTINIDTLTRHGAIFVGIDHRKATEEEFYNYKFNYIAPIIKQPDSMLRFTRAMKFVATAYLKNKNQENFLKNLTASMKHRR